VYKEMLEKLDKRLNDGKILDEKTILLIRDLILAVIREIEAIEYHIGGDVDEFDEEFGA